MSDPAAFIHIDLGGRTRIVGRLWIRSERNKESASFEFDDSWISDPVHFALGPALPATAGAFHSGEGRAMFGALGDSAPDRWGRRLIARNEARRAREDGQTPRAPREFDYLIGVTDIVRQGALRFSFTPDGPFIAQGDDSSVPPLVNLGEMLTAAAAIDEDPDSLEAENAVRLLLAPGSSLGGARPKASVRERNGTLAIAKFPEKGDQIDAVRWEAVLLTMASNSGIVTPKARIETVGATAVLLVERFDREGSNRIPFLSAMSLLEASDGETRSYVEISDALRRISSHASSDAHQLWRRLAFNILASNFDDHLRNHAIMYDGAGWTLTPAYDLNPVPRSVKDRLLSTAINIDEDTTASIELAIEAADEFMLTRDDAKAIAGQVAHGISSWRSLAAQNCISATEVERMESAFEHSDATLARSWV